MEPLCGLAVDKMVALINLGMFGDRDVVEERVAERDAWAWFLHVCGVLCRESATICSKEPLYPLLVWYERTRLRLCDHQFFLDLLPQGVAVLGMPSPVGLPAADLEKLKRHHASEDRVTTLVKLEEMDPTSTRRTQLSLAHVQTDLPARTPESVRIFFSRVRGVNNGLRSAKSPTEWAQCENAACQRSFFSGVAASSTQGHREGGLGAYTPTQHYCHNLRVEWPDDCPHLRFCSRACFHNYIDNYRVMFGNAELDALVQRTQRTTRKQEGRSRPAAEFRAAIERNRDVKGQLLRKRLLSRPPQGHSAASVKKIFVQHTNVLNTDTALLFLGSVLCEMDAFNHIDAPGGLVGWRDHPRFFHVARQILLQQTKHNYPLIVDFHPASHSLLQRVRRTAHRLSQELNNAQHSR